MYGEAEEFSEGGSVFFGRLKDDVRTDRPPSAGKQRGFPPLVRGPPSSSFIFSLKNVFLLEARNSSAVTRFLRTERGVGVPVVKSRSRWAKHRL